MGEQPNVGGGTVEVRDWLVIAVVGVVLAATMYEMLTKGEHSTPDLLGDLAKLTLGLYFTAKGGVQLAKLVVKDKKK